VSPRVKLKADCASDAGGNVITVHKDCRLCCVSLAFNMPAGLYKQCLCELYGMCEGVSGSGEGSGEADS